MSYTTILTDLSEGVLTLTFNRPEVLNAFNDQQAHEVQEALKQAERDKAVVRLRFERAAAGFTIGHMQLDLGALRFREPSAQEGRQNRAIGMSRGRHEGIFRKVAGCTGGVTWKWRLPGPTFPQVYSISSSKT